jgi:hypothetical protein
LPTGTAGKGSEGPHNKGMQLTRPVQIAASQLLPGVRPTLGEKACVADGS